MPSTAAGSSMAAGVVTAAQPAATGASAPGAGPPRRRARRSDSVRNASLVTEAAIELFADRGMDVTLAQVADLVLAACGTYPPDLGGQPG